ncbi:TnsA endonuclease N-terminal domain-containing protein [Paenibacillus sp. L3-i20]|uniref:TnsA endonuclease N-terminal domain-containing protein n=1 Tax=Paenibacillus sp. L3-i20 TaxID=2905833 RepID=UPI001EDF5C61|nr:TnsA endonuclease N-terminal domain-containing protein [Paenibacillus sp. L3-i20]GKU76631.1 transposase [Paenibacillus sp. L3-i20]
MSLRGSRITKLHTNYIKKGRGQGSGKDYKPFIQAHDNKTASEGWLTRHKGWKTARIHHTLSEHERKFLYLCEWSDRIIDIREQWPLLPIQKTIEIAEQLGITHANVDGTPVTMTTDFKLTVLTKNEAVDEIVTVKPNSKLDERTLELFEIERRYFAEQGTAWRIITEDEIPEILVTNVEWLVEAKYLNTRPGMDDEILSLVSEELYAFIVYDAGQSAISKLCLRADKSFGLQQGTSLFILQHMLANKRWVTDMHTKKIKEFEPLVIQLNSQVMTSTSSIHFA